MQESSEIIESEPESAPELVSSQESDDVVFVEESIPTEETEPDTDDLDGGSLTSGSLSPEPMVDLTEETPAPKRKPVPMIDLTETMKLPTPEPIGKLAAEETSELNTSTNSLPGRTKNFRITIYMGHIWTTAKLDDSSFLAKLDDIYFFRKNLDDM